MRAAWKAIRSAGWGSLTAVLTLAVGIGASLTAGVVAYAGLARPLPFPRGDRLVTIIRAFDPTRQ